MCYMERVTHREMRNQSAELLRRVEAGESFIVTNRGHATAVIRPATPQTVEELIRQGHGRNATKDILTLRSIPRRVSTRSSADILRDSRGTW